MDQASPEDGRCDWTIGVYLAKFSVDTGFFEGGVAFCSVRQHTVLASMGELQGGCFGCSGVICNWNMRGSHGAIAFFSFPLLHFL
jgi:hypothetical protein